MWWNLTRALNSKKAPYRKPLSLYVVFVYILLGVYVMYNGFVAWLAVYARSSTPPIVNVLISGFIILVGAVAIIGAPIIYLRSHRRTGKIAELLASGTKIQGVVKRVASRSSAYTNILQFYLEGRDLVTQAARTYKSDFIYGDTVYALKTWQDTPIILDIYVNPSNPNEYYVDPSGIPTAPAETNGGPNIPPTIGQL